MTQTFRLERREGLALALSVLLHLLVTLLLQSGVLSNLDISPQEHSIEVDLVTAPPPPKAPPERPAAPPAPQAEPAAEPQQPAAAPQPPLPVQRPQLEPAPLADKSTASKPSPKTETAKPARNGTGLAVDSGSVSRPAQAAGDLSQSAQDMVLSQVIRMWHFDPVALRGTRTVLTATLLVNQDGTLSGPMSKNAPWAPGEVIDGYDNMPDGTNRRMLETFLLALRVAQPLRLPPDDGKPWPRRMVLRFRPGDL